MKPLGRIFFIACINEQRRVYDLDLIQREFSIRVIINIFSRLSFSHKQLMYYIKKWNMRGFYDYGVTLDLGWLEFEKLYGEYKAIYEEIKQNGLDYWAEEEFSEYIQNKTSKNTYGLFKA